MKKKHFKHSIHYKNYQKSRNGEKFINLIKIIYKNPTANIRLDSKRLDVFPLSLETKQNVDSHHPYST